MKLTIARRPEMISNSWLSFELSMYSDRVAKKGETSSFAESPSATLLVLIGTTGSDPKDLRVHKRGCRRILGLSGSADLSLGSETETGGDRGWTSGKEERNWQWTERGGAAMGEVCDWRLSGRDFWKKEWRVKNKKWMNWVHVRSDLRTVTWRLFGTLTHFSISGRWGETQLRSSLIGWKRFGSMVQPNQNLFDLC